MEVKHRMMRGLVVFGVVFLGGFSLLPIDAFADPGLDFSVVISDVPILEINLSDANGSAIGATTTMDVVPDHGTAAFNEKNMVVSVGTNNEWGYNLNMNVSNTVLTSQENSNNTIANLVSKAGGYTCTSETADTCDFTVNSWGYKIASATNIGAATNYLPVVSSVNLNHYNNRTNGDLTYVSFGSKVNTTLAPGTYQTTINFIATANPDPTPIMQNVSASDLASLIPSDGNTTTLKDSRDNNKYQITNINGTYWMTSNLKIMGTISASDSNFTGADFNISSGGDLTAGNDYTTPRAHYNTSDTNSSTYGAYYNYCAASAGTVCSQTQQNATSDICPKGWRLPTQTEMNSFVSASSSNKNPVLAGGYYGGSFYDAGSYDYWWSATAVSATDQYLLRYDGSSWLVYGSYKIGGYSVRCVYDIPTMQNVTSNALAELMPSSGDSTTLTDRRDGSNYMITNIDGAYWMTQNLRIMGTVSAADSNFTGADFNISAGGDLTAGDTFTEPRAHFNASDTDSATYGAYYNYCAASAGTVCSETKQDATSDICPKGWRLPSQAEITNVAKSNGASFNSVFAGSYGNGSLSNFGDEAYWWSATSSYAGGRWYILFNDDDHRWEIHDESKTYSYSIRCIYDTPNMQSMTNAKLAELMPNSGDNTTLTDVRDGRRYRITNINGAYWMTDNLKIMGTISAAESNFTGADFDVAAGGNNEHDDYYTEPVAFQENGGGRYNYCAASAGSVCDDSDNTQGDDAVSDICPSGWRLPTRDEFQDIVDGSYSNWNPTGFLIWWSSTAVEYQLVGCNDYSYALSAYKPSDEWEYYIDPLGEDSHRGKTYSIRCISKF